MKKIVVFCLALVAGAGMAAEKEMSEVRRHDETLKVKLDTCAMTVRTIFVMLRSKGDTTEDVKRAEECVVDGKAAVKDAYAQVKTAFGKRKPPEQLADWRLDWASAFDAAALQPSDTERAYLQRVGAARQSVERATNKLEMALE